MKTIHSRENPYFKQVYRWAHQGRVRREAGVVLLDGLHLLQSLLDLGGVLDQVLFSAYGAGRQEIVAWLAAHAEIAACRLPDHLFAQLVGTENPSGILGIARLPAHENQPARHEDCLLLDGVQDPGNVGALLRTAAAAGIKQVVLSSGCADAWAPKTLRAAQGAQFALAIHENHDLCEFIKDYAGQVLVTTPQATQGLYQLSFSGPVAWVFGAEGRGVSPSVAAMADWAVRIPMPGKIESLNVAAAAAICLFETLRSRDQARG